MEIRNLVPEKVLNVYINSMSMEIRNLVPEKVLNVYINSISLDTFDFPEEDTIETRATITEMIYRHGYLWFESEVPVSTGGAKKVKEYFPQAVVKEYLSSLKDFFTIFDNEYEGWTYEYQGQLYLVEKDESASFPEAVVDLLLNIVIFWLYKDVELEQATAPAQS